MAVTRNLMTRFGADFSGLYKGMAKAQNSIASFQRSVVGTLAAVGVGFEIRNIVSDAIKVEGAVGQITHMMGKSAQEFVDWADTSAAAFGMSKRDALIFGRSYAGLTSIFSSNTEEMKNNTIELLKASAIVSAKSGRTMEDVLERIRSGMLGNTEAIEDLNVNVYTAAIEQTEAFKKLGQGAKTWDDLQNYSLKQQIRYYAILEQITKQYGDELGDNTQVRVLKFTAALGNLKTALGTAFLPILYSVLPALTTLIQKLTVAAKFLEQFTYALFGLTGKIGTKGLDKQAQGISDIEDGLNGASKAQEGFLAGFDEINSIPAPSSGDGLGNTKKYEDALGGGMPDGMGDQNEVIFVKITEQAKKAAEEVKVFLEGIKTFAKDVYTTVEDLTIKFAPALVFLGGFAATLGVVRLAMLAWQGAIFLVTNAQKTMIAVQTILNTVMALNPIVLIIAILVGLVAAIIVAYKTSDTFRAFVDKLWGSMKAVGNWIKDIFMDIIHGLVVGWDGLKDGIAVAGEEFKKFGNWVSSIFMGIMQGLWDILKDIGNFIGDAFVWYFTTLWDTLKLIGNFIADSFTKSWNDLVWVMTWLWEKVIVPLSKFIANSFIKSWNDLVWILNWLWEKVLVPVGNFLEDTFKNAIDGVGVAANVLWDTMKVVGNGIGNVFDTMWSGIKTAINFILGGINDVINGINSIMSFELPSFLGGGSIGVKIPNIPKLARGGIVDSPTVAQIGEAGKEMVVPLENTSFVDKLASALGTAVMSAMGSQGGQSAGDIVINVGGSNLARITASELNRLNRQAGRTILQV